MKLTYLALALIFLCNTTQGQSWRDFQYQTGDLLFQDLDCGDLCDAIEAVTPALEKKHFSHMGMVYKVGDSTYVIEALGKDVHLTYIDVFIQRQFDTSQQPKVVVGRLKKAYQKLNSRAVGFALKQVGQPYDDAFLLDNGKYYCSELVYDAYKSANNDLPFFHLYPMTFRQPGTKKTYPAWKAYYKYISIKVPEGKPGCNPGSIAVNDNVEIVASFY